MPEPVHRALNRTTQRGAAPTGEAAAAARSTTLSALRRDLRGDLDRIVQRALAKQPDARYSSVGALADDLRAFVDGRAISGGSRRYRLRVFVRRHWLPLAAAAMILLILIGSGAAVVWQSQRVAHEAQNTLQVKDFLFGLFTAVDPHEAKGREVSARELLDRGADRVAQNAALDAEQRAEIEATLGRTYYQLGLFDQASKLQDNTIRVLSADPARHLLLARTQSDRADTLTELGDLKGAAALAGDARNGIEASPDASSADRARALRTQVSVALGQRDFAAAKRYSDSELAIMNSSGAEPRVRYQALMAAGGASWGLETWQDAEALFREALAVAASEPHPDELNVAKAQSNIAMALQTQSRYVEAVPLQEQALATDEKMLGADHAATMAARRDLALTEHHLGHYAKARAMLEQVIAAQRSKLGNEHPAIAGSEINLGIVLIDSGDAASAETVLAESLAIFEKKYGRDYQGAHIALGNLAAVHLAQGKLDQAETELKEVVDWETKRSQTDKDSVITLVRQGDLQHLRGDLDAAAALHRRAVAGAHEKYGENNRYTANAHQHLGSSLRDGGDVTGAERELRAALASYAGYLPNAEHPLAATTRYDLALLLLSRPDTRGEGVRLLGEAADLREKFLGADDPKTRQARDALRDALAPAKT
jgi:serine/threonine-protein kinase